MNIWGFVKLSIRIELTVCVRGFSNTSMHTIEKVSILCLVCHNTSFVCHTNHIEKFTSTKIYQQHHPRRQKMKINKFGLYMHVCIHIYVFRFIFHKIYIARPKSTLGYWNLDLAIATGCIYLHTISKAIDKNENEMWTLPWENEMFFPTYAYHFKQFCSKRFPVLSKANQISLPYLYKPIDDHKFNDVNCSFFAVLFLSWLNAKWMNNKNWIKKEMKLLNGHSMCCLLCVFDAVRKTNKNHKCKQSPTQAQN